MRFPALQSRNFRVYEIGSLFAVNGQWINRVVIGWVGWELTGSATWVGLLSFFLFAPTFALSPLFGVLMDRIKLRWAAIVSHAVLTLAILVLYILHLSGELTVWGLSVLALVIGVGSSADRSIRMTIVPRMVEREVLPNAVAIHSTNFNLARLVGPAIGGIMIDALGTSTTMLVNVVVLLPTLVAFLFLELRERDQLKGARQRFLVELWGGARHAVHHPIIREAMILTGISSFAVRGVAEIVPVIADGVFNRGAEGLGQMLAAGGAGAVVASLVIAMRPARHWTGGIPLIAHVALFVGLLAVASLGVAETWIVAMLSVFMTGFCGTMVGVSMQATIQLRVEDAYRGRVMSLWIVVGMGTVALGALVLGGFADIFGIAGTLAGAGLAGVALVVAVRLALSRRAGSNEARE